MAYEDPLGDNIEALGFVDAIINSIASHIFANTDSSQRLSTKNDDLFLLTVCQLSRCTHTYGKKQSV
jgi:hypothetical protein